MSDIERNGSISIVDSVQADHSQKLRRHDCPNLEKSKKVSSPSGVNSKSLGSNKQNIINFMAIPPLIANSLDSSTSMQPLNVLVHCLVATTSFDEKKQGVERVYKSRGRDKGPHKIFIGSEHGKMPHHHLHLFIEPLTSAVSQETRHKNNFIPSPKTEFTLQCLHSLKQHYE